MREIKSAVAVFCIACICAEILAQLVGDGWPKKCIKTLAGLYILLSLTHALPAVKAEWSAFEAPQPASVSFGTVEDAVLRQAEQKLAQTLQEECLSQTGVEILLQVTLCRDGESVTVSAVQGSFPTGCTAAERERATDYLRQTLGVAPEWQSGEDGR